MQGSTQRMLCVHSKGKENQLEGAFTGHIQDNIGFPGGARGKEPECQFRRLKKPGFDSWVGKIPWRRQPTTVFLSGESHGRRSLAHYDPQGSKEWDTTEATVHTHTGLERAFRGHIQGNVGIKTNDDKNALSQLNNIGNQSPSDLSKLITN